MRADAEQQYRRMTGAPLHRLIASLSVPTVVSSVISSVYNLTDTYFVSQLGTAASAAVGVVFSLQSLIQAFGYGFGMGAGAIAARSLGEKNEKRAAVCTASAFCIAFVFGVLLAVLCVPNLDVVMRLFGANDDCIGYAREYAFWILLGAPLMASTFVLNIVMRSCGKTGLSMAGIGVGAVVNLLLDPFFISEKYLNLGMAGAAIATIIGQMFSFAVFSVFYATGKSVVPFSFRNVSRRFSDYWDIVRTGAPTIFRQGMACVSSLFLNRAIKPFGTAALAALTIANKLYLFIRGLLLGIGQGYQSVAGYNYGAGQYARVRRGFWITVMYGTVVAVLFTGILAGFAPQIMRVFRAEDAEVVEYGAFALVAYCFSLPFLAYSSYVNQTLQSLGQVKSASFLALCRNGILYLPLLAVLPRLFGLTGIQTVQPIADLLTCAVSVPFQIVFFRKLMQNDGENGKTA